MVGLGRNLAPKGTSDEPLAGPHICHANRKLQNAHLPKQRVILLSILTGNTESDKTDRITTRQQHFHLVGDAHPSEMPKCEVFRCAGAMPCDSFS